MTENEILFKIIKSEVLGVKPEEDFINQLNEEIIVKLLKLAKKHDLDHIVASFVKNNKISISNDAILNNVRDCLFSAAIRRERIDHELDNVTRILEKNNIQFVCLKGAVLKDFYYKSWMRTSCDIDILIHEEDIKKMISIFVDKYTYTCGEMGKREVTLWSPTKEHVEFHYNLVLKNNGNNAFAILSNPWDYVVDKNIINQKFTNEFFYLYHITHLAKHLCYSGCGIRPFIDLFLIIKNLELDKDILDDLLVKANLVKFNDSVVYVAKYIMGEVEKDEKYDTLIEYIIDSGIYGNSNINGKINKENRFIFLLKCVFPPISSYNTFYPRASKCKLLIPFLWVARTFSVLFLKGHDNGKKMVKSKLKQSKKDRENIEKFFDDIGINR